MYRLTRDDGEELLVTSGVWEAALELGFLYGWKPAGTETPRTDAWRGLEARGGVAVWNRQDYFSHTSQRVGQSDAGALAEAVHLALSDISDIGPSGRGAAPSAGNAPQSVVPCRATALADGLSPYRRKGMQRFAAFAECGGFTIGNK